VRAIAIVLLLLPSASRAEPGEVLLRGRADEDARVVTGAALEKGVALGLFAEDPGWSYRGLLEEIAATGADHVELVVAWYQRDASSTEIAAHPRYTAPDKALARTIAEARAVGLAVLLFPIVRLSAPRTPDEWRGTLAPRDPDAWWRSYRARLLALARLGAAAGAAGLSVGSELSSLDGPRDRARWAALIAEVRQVFRGPLVYSGNWDHFHDVAIYDLVDRVGLCGYFALAGATVDERVVRWRAIADALERFTRAAGRPLVFTEVGYPSQRGAAARPWDETARAPVDLEEQRRCYEAFRRVWQDAAPELLAGVYFWNWYGWGGAASGGYTPRGKPAADEIRRWYRARPPSIPQAGVGQR
jgi:hypothetical protein